MLSPRTSLLWPRSGAARRVVAWRIPDIDLYAPATSPNDLYAFLLVNQSYVSPVSQTGVFRGDTTRLSVLFCCDNPADLITIADVSVVAAIDVVVRYGLIEVGLVQIDRLFRVAGVLIPEVAKFLERVRTAGSDFLEARVAGFILLLFHEEQKICRRESLVWTLQLVVKPAQSPSNTGLQGRRCGPERAGCIDCLAGSAGCGS